MKIIPVPFEKFRDQNNMVCDLEKLLNMNQQEVPPISAREEPQVRTAQDNFHPLIRQFTTGLDSPKSIKLWLLNKN